METSLHFFFNLSLYLFVYLLIESNGMYIDSVIHPFNLFPPSTFGFQMFMISAGPSPLIDHSVCSKDGGTVLYPIDVLQGNNVLKVDNSLEWPQFLASQVCFHGDELIKTRQLCDIKWLYQRSWTSLPTPFISAQQLSERRSAESVCE
jgi:hypothetical protein